MRTRSIFTTAVGLAVALAIGLLPPVGSADPSPAPETFAAVAHLPTVAPSTASVTLHVTGYSDRRKVRELHSLLVDNGPDALLNALEAMEPIGKIERTGTVGFYDLKVILSIPTENGRRILALTDRPIGFLEAYFNTRSTDYKFGFLRLDLHRNENGREEGEGEMIYAAKVKVLDDGTIEVENFGIRPIQLLGVRQL